MTSKRITKRVRGVEFNAIGKALIKFRLPQSIARDCSHQGQCSEDVEYWVSKLRPQLGELQPETIIAALKPYGAWDADELANHEENLNRFLWLAAGHLIDEAELCGQWRSHGYMECY